MKTDEQQVVRAMCRIRRQRGEVAGDSDNGLHELFLEFDEAVWKGEAAIPLMSGKYLSVVLLEMLLEQWEWLSNID